MSRRAAHTLAVALLAALGGACGSARTLEEAKAGGTCTPCHGGTESSTGAPPRDAHGGVDPSLVSVGAHGSHLGAAHGIAAPVACGSCHVVPSRFPEGSHGDGDATVSLGELARRGGVEASWDRAAATCSVYCHGASLAGGDVTAPIWTKVDGTQVQCGSCHGAPPPRPHPQRADCGTCHPGTVQASGGIVSGGAHLDGDVDVDPAAMGCTDCHGDAARSGSTLLRAAPPTGTAGETDPSTRAVGAHQAHLANTRLAQPVACGECHSVPATPAHSDDLVQVVFGALATPDTGESPKWDRDTLRCSGTYCHGATLGAGGTNTAPRWTGGPGEAACGSCHGLPPPSGHPVVSGGLPACSACHPGSVDGAGAIIPAASGGLHLDGTPQAVGGHEPSWTDPASPGFHAYAANRGLSSCQVCHGEALDGACGRCHTGAAAPELTCTGCHGGVDNSTGAPPKPQWAARNVPDETALRVGAHSRHVTASSIAPTFDCDVCHPKPASMLTAGHIDLSERADVVFGGLAVTGLAPAPTWDRAAGTCAVYCHGATLGGGSIAAPGWTAVGQGQASCGTCHGLPPPAPHPAAADLAACHDCHPETVDTAGALVPPATGGTHLNGLLDGGHLASWMDSGSAGFHAYAANRGLASCRLCHGSGLDGVGGSSTVACADCHAGVAAPALTCTGCHGGADGPAPPRATWGNRTDPVRVGAHTSHVGTNPVSAPITCGACHQAPASMFTDGHIDPARAEVVFQGPGVWNYPATSQPTCSSTYCHGNFVNGLAANTPDWTAADQAACGTCHPARPAAYLHNRHQRNYDAGLIPWWPLPGGSTWVTCDQCHSGIAQSVDGTLPPALTVVNGSGPALHVDGKKDVVFKAGGTFDGGQRTCSGLACHPGETKSW